MKKLPLWLLFALAVSIFFAKDAKAQAEPKQTTIGSRSAATLTLDAPDFVAVPWWPRWDHKITIANAGATDQIAHLTIDAPQINQLAVGSGDLGTCVYPSPQSAVCDLKIAAGAAWDIDVAYSLNATGRWFFMQCIQTGCKKTTVQYPSWTTYVPDICNGCNHNEAAITSAQVKQKTVLPMHDKGAQISSSGTTTVTFWICMELGKDQVQWGDAVHLSDAPAEAGVPQLVSTRFTPALEFNVTQVPTTVCTKATQAGAREFDARVERGGKFATYIGFYTALPLGTTTTVVDPNPIKSTDTVLIASLEQLDTKLIPSIKVGTGRLEIHTLFIPDGGKCKNVAGPVASEDEKAGTTDISVQQLVSAPTYAPYQGEMSIKVYRYQTDFEDEIVIADMSALSVSVTGPMCNSSNMQELYLPAIRALMQ